IDELKAALDATSEALARLRGQNQKLADQDTENSTQRQAAATEALTKAWLDLYNRQMLNAQAIDEQGRALTGIDLELFKTDYEAATEAPENAAEAIRKYAEEAKKAQANLSIDGALKQLQQQNGLLDVRLQLGREEADLQEQLARYAGADDGRVAALEQEI